MTVKLLAEHYFGVSKHKRRVRIRAFWRNFHWLKESWCGIKGYSWSFIKIHFWQSCSFKNVIKEIMILLHAKITVNSIKYFHGNLQAEAMVAKSQNIF